MKCIRIDMNKQSVRQDELPEELALFGGRGLTGAIINKEVPPDCDALGKDNKLIFAPGLLSGTSLVNTSRISIGAKSPLTGTIKESNAGGTAGAYLGRMGISAVIVEGKPSEGELYTLYIDENGSAELVEATGYQHLGTYDLVRKIYEKFDDKSSVLCIGPTGEHGLALASIQSSDADGRPCRAAGRGGLGAVMGAKGLKAVVISPRSRSLKELGDADSFKNAGKQFADAVKNHPFTGQALPALGTAALVSLINHAGAFPSYNAREGMFEQWEKISGEAMAEIIQSRGGKNKHMGCSQCIIHCSNEYVDEGGEYVTGSLEYETIWSLGGMIGVDDLDTVARMDFLCDNYGLDTMGAGVAIAVAMDSGHAKFGDGQAAVDMLQEIAQASSFGKILGQGPSAVGEHFGNPRVPAVKGQSIAAYDPRAIQGNGVTYATSPMGADHTAGNTINDNLDSIGGQLDPLKAEGQVESSRNSQIAMALLDNLGLCIFTGVTLAEEETQNSLLMAINAVTGSNIGLQGMWGLGVKTLLMEKEFNQQAGFSEKDDRLPEFFYKEPLPPHNTVFVVADDDLDETLRFG